MRLDLTRFGLFLDEDVPDAFDELLEEYAEEVETELSEEVASVDEVFDDEDELAEELEEDSEELLEPDASDLTSPTTIIPSFGIVWPSAFEFSFLSATFASRGLLGLTSLLLLLGLIAVSTSIILLLG